MFLSYESCIHYFTSDHISHNHLKQFSIIVKKRQTPNCSELHVHLRWERQFLLSTLIHNYSCSKFSDLHIHIMNNFNTFFVYFLHCAQIPENKNCHRFHLTNCLYIINSRWKFFKNITHLKNNFSNNHATNDVMMKIRRTIACAINHYYSYDFKALPAVKKINILHYHHNPFPCHYYFLSFENT